MFLCISCFNEEPSPVEVLDLGLFGRLPLLGLHIYVVLHVVLHVVRGCIVHSDCVQSVNRHGPLTGDLPQSEL